MFHSIPFPPKRRRDATSQEDHQAVNPTYEPWKATYWSTMFLAYTLLPLSRDILLSGKFSMGSRIRDGARRCSRTYALMAAAGVVGIGLLAAYLHDLHVVPVLMALGNTYGLVLVVLLLGYGLVDVPRSWWRQASPESELRRARIVAGGADEALFDAVWELQDCEGSIDLAAAAVERVGAGSGSGTAAVKYAAAISKLLEWRERTATLSPELQRRRTFGSGGGGAGGSSGGRETRRGGRRRGGHHRLSGNGGGGGGGGGDDGDDGLPSLDALAGLGARLKMAQADVVSAEQKWNHLIERARIFGELADEYVPPPPGAVPPSPRAASTSLLSGSGEPALGVCCCCFGKRARSCWVRYLRSPTYRAVAVLTATLSGMVLWSEATLTLPVNLSPFALFLGLSGEGEGNKEESQGGLVYQIAALVPLLYMSLCTFSSLFKINIFGPFCLRGNRQSTGVALVFNAQYLVRLQFPLIYNYLLMLKYDTSSTTCAFSKFYSNIETVPFFGTSFNSYAPLLILALGAFTMCNGYARILSLIGIDHEDALLLSDKDTLDEKVSEGIQLIRRHGEREATLVETEDEFCGVNGGGVAGNGASNGVGGGTGNGDMGSSLSSLPSGGARGRYSGEMV